MEGTGPLFPRQSFEATPNAPALLLCSEVVLQLAKDHTVYRNATGAETHESVASCGSMAASLVDPE